MVGFVLPCTEKGLPITEAVSFNQMQQSCKLQVANYAYIHMVSPLSEHTPVFCLACVGTDNNRDFQPKKFYILQILWYDILCCF